MGLLRGKAHFKTPLLLYFLTITNFYAYFIAKRFSFLTSALFDKTISLRTNCFHNILLLTAV